MDKLLKLISMCRCGVYLTVNQHRDYYETAAQKLEESEGYECPPEIDEIVKQKMIGTNTIITIQFYPDTPIGSYEIWHYDLELALNEAIECLTDNTALEPTGEGQHKNVE